MKRNMPEIIVIIPAFNEEMAIANVIADIPKNLVSEIVVVDNNSTDSTPLIARKAGATVICEYQQGYGFACLKGIEYIQTRDQGVDVVVFLDADYSDFPEEMQNLIQPIITDNCDLVVGSRLLGSQQKGAMPSHQLIGNRIATLLLKLLYGLRCTDLGPFRAIKFDKLLALDMKDQTYGWTVEMQAKAAKQKFRYCEVPVSYRPRIGTSKISGTLSGSLKASYSIITTLLKYR
jgi:glycosyltransferase involved in cell wall biosynthesis